MTIARGAHPAKRPNYSGEGGWGAGGCNNSLNRGEGEEGDSQDPMAASFQTFRLTTAQVSERASPPRGHS